MTGSEIALWLEDIWYDLLHLSTADVPLLLIRLFVLFVVSFFGWQRRSAGLLVRMAEIP